MGLMVGPDVFMYALCPFWFSVTYVVASAGSFASFVLACVFGM